MKEATEKDCLIYLSGARIILSEFIQGYNKDTDPHYVLYMSYIELASSKYTDIRKQIADKSYTETIDVLDMWIKQLAKEVDFKITTTDIDEWGNTALAQAQFEVEKILAVLHKDYKFDIDKIRYQLKDLIKVKRRILL